MENKGLNTPRSLRKQRNIMLPQTIMSYPNFWLNAACTELAALDAVVNTDLVVACISAWELTDTLSERLSVNSVTDLVIS